MVLEYLLLAWASHFLCLEWPPTFSAHYQLKGDIRKPSIPHPKSGFKRQMASFDQLCTMQYQNADSQMHCPRALPLRKAQHRSHSKSYMLLVVIAGILIGVLLISPSPFFPHCPRFFVPSQPLGSHAVSSVHLLPNCWKRSPSRSIIVSLLPSGISEIQFIPTQRTPSSLLLPGIPRTQQKVPFNHNYPPGFWKSTLVPSSSILFPSLTFVCLFLFSNALSNCFNFSPSKNLVKNFPPFLLVLESKPKASYTLSKHFARVYTHLQILVVSFLCSPLLARAHYIAQAGPELASTSSVLGFQVPVHGHVC